jgi:ubiquinone/menaquinone biosynthesis C-methylase UbiE
MAGGFRGACVLGAAAELDLFGAIPEEGLSAEGVAGRLDCDLRATRALLNALAALRLLEKREDQYFVPGELRPLVVEGTAQTILPMIRHLTNVMRGWSQLAWVAKAGIPAPRAASIRGFEGDREAFIGGMHSISGPVAAELVARIAPPPLKHLLDVGGASGTWTIAFLEAVPGSRATIFDLPDAIQLARQRFAGSDLAGRVALAAGDFYRDELPGGADFAWLSAIAHQHSRQHNRELFAKVYRALEPGGWIALRDVVMEPCRTRPPEGALFAINMLANTDSGGTYTYQEFAEDLQRAGFVAPELRVKSEDMNCVVVARRP